MAALVGFEADLEYEDRRARLVTAGVALWDVLESCERPGSLDSSIVVSTERENDLGAFFREHPSIRVVGLNGGKAASAYARWLRRSDGSPPAMALPSTSGANARLSWAGLVEAWRPLTAHPFADPASGL
jgi:hypoxanthine-DNA glycosylase